MENLGKNVINGFTAMLFLALISLTYKGWVGSLELIKGDVLYALVVGGLVVCVGSATSLWQQPNAKLWPLVWKAVVTGSLLALVIALAGGYFPLKKLNLDIFLDLFQNFAGCLIPAAFIGGALKR